MQDSNRTCNLIVGIGDGKAEMVNGIQYSGYVANPYWDVNQLPVNDTWHPKIDNMVYNGMDWDCPSYTKNWANILRSITATCKLAMSLGTFYQAYKQVTYISHCMT